MDHGLDSPLARGPRFRRELAVRPINPGLAAILTRAHLRAIGPAQLRRRRSDWRTFRFATPRSSWSTSRPPAVAPPADGHDAITEIGAVKVRGGAVLGELATLVDPGRSIPPQIVALTGITSAMVCNAPTHRVGAAVVPGVLPRRSAGRPQRRLRHRVPAGGRRTLPDRLAAAAGAVHGQAGPPGAHPRRGTQRAAVCAGPALRRGHHPDPPRARRRPRHRRRAARADRAGRQPGRAHLRRTALVSARRDAGPATQPPPRPRPAAPARASTCSAGPAPRCSTSAPRSICADGSASTSTAPTRAPGSRRWRRWPPRSTTSSARTISKPACASCGCSPPTPRPTTGGRSSRTGGGGWC